MLLECDQIYFLFKRVPKKENFVSDMLKLSINIYYDASR